MTEFLLLDFQRPKETELCVNSIRKHAKINHKIRLLHNGPAEEYHGDLLQSGAIDYLHCNDANLGCGMGIMQLFLYCKTPFCFFVQVDQILNQNITPELIGKFKIEINKGGVSYIDVAGNQGHGKFSERAAFIPVDWYNSIPKVPAGPGPFSHLKWTEECVQEHMEQNKQRFKSVFLFTDIGKYSIRSNPDGSVWKHRTDNKNIQCLKKPSEKYVFPPFSDEQWERALKGNWPTEGEVPKEWEKHVFEFWDSQINCPV